MLNIDLSILDFIQTHLRCGFGDFIMPIITYMGNGGFFWICLSAILCLIPRYRKYGVTMFISLVFDLLMCNIILKPLIARPRPFKINTKINLLISPPNDYSFPSGHTACAFSSVFALFFGRSRLWKPTGIIAVLIAFSRLYLYVHYPSDVFAGMLLGLIIGFISNKIYCFFHKRFLVHKQIT